MESVSAMLSSHRRTACYHHRPCLRREVKVGDRLMSVGPIVLPDADSRIATRSQSPSLPYGGGPSPNVLRRPGAPAWRNMLCGDHQPVGHLCTIHRGCKDRTAKCGLAAREGGSTLPNRHCSSAAQRYGRRRSAIRSVSLMLSSSTSSHSVPPPGTVPATWI